jgi:hypothetical protein
VGLEGLVDVVEGVVEGTLEREEWCGRPSVATRIAARI